MRTHAIQGYPMCLHTEPVEGLRGARYVHSHHCYKRHRNMTWTATTALLLSHTLGATAAATRAIPKVRPCCAGAAGPLACGAPDSRYNKADLT